MIRARSLEARAHDVTPRRRPMTRFSAVSPYLYYGDHAKEALDWLARVFGFGPSTRYVDDAGVVHEGHIMVGDTPVMVCGASPAEAHGQGMLLIVHLDDVDAHYRRTVAAGVDASPPEDKPYGPRAYSVTDPWGYTWAFWEHVSDYVEGGVNTLHEIEV
jgi:uncharacterized glyoxalase superfamily protein PhnB